MTTPRLDAGGMGRTAAVGYVDDSVGYGGTTLYLLEVVGALDRGRFHPVFFTPRAQVARRSVRPGRRGGDAGRAGHRPGRGGGPGHPQLYCLCLLRTT